MINDGIGYSNYIGGLQSTTYANSYSEGFKGVLNYFEWIPNAHYTGNQFRNNYVTACPIGCRFTRCRLGANVCFIVCGDGIRDDGEECDDANSRNGDGCSNLCTVEIGYSCGRIDNTASNPEVCTLLCGNGALDPNEECDDHNIVDSDGCSSSCNVDQGYSCDRVDITAAYPDTCLLNCGNGIQDEGEECDPREDDRSVLCNECRLYKYSVARIELTEENDMVITLSSPLPDIEAIASCKCVNLSNV